MALFVQLLDPRRAGTALLVLALTAAVSGARAGEPGTLAWQSLDGTRCTARTGRATLFFFGSTRCPCADGYTGRILEVQRDYAARGVRSFMVFSGGGTPRQEVESYLLSRKIGFPSVHDADGRLAEQLGAKATPTAVLLDERGRVRYRGRIDDNPEPIAVRRRELREALDAFLAGEKVPVAETRVFGCALGGGKEARASKPAALEDGIGEVRFPVTTTVPEAQRFFNQGMARWFGFNFPEAEASFREVLRRDPQCAMAHWGLALTLGMNYNTDYDPARLPEAHAAAQKALSMVAGVRPKERALIRAMAARHPADAKPEDQKLEAYHDEMARVYEEYREDLHIDVLYAASGMDLRPWALWRADGRPEPGTLEILLVLEDTLRRDPKHIGANHFYIHATEASPHPERALPSARRLAELAPRSGHLVHMPAHTFQRVGDYQESARSNGRAAGVDSAYFAAAGGTNRYAGYYIHNLDFLIAAYLMDGRSREALETARGMAKVVANLTPDDAPIWCGGGSSVISVYARLGKWDEILRAPEPPPTSPFSLAVWRYARGMALLGRSDMAGAEKELAKLREEAKRAEEAVPPIPVPGLPDALKKSFRVSVSMLHGKVLLAKGDEAAAVRALQAGAAVEDSMPYIEPAVWRYPLREALGAALLKLGRAAEAESVFREELARNRKSGRALFGLMHALERQGKADEAARVRTDFQDAWKRADMTLSIETL